jgi:hypothetical protein
MQGLKVLIHVRVAKIPKDMLDRLSSRKKRYYKRQALKVANILNHRVMQSLLKEVITSENISLHNIDDIRVMVLPSVKDREYGDHLFGSYDHEKCRISIYPAVKYKGPRFLTDPMVSFQFIRESFDTLVHEVLHAKYPQESTVKKLTRKYLKRFYQMLQENLE